MRLAFRYDLITHAFIIIVKHSTITFPTEDLGALKTFIEY